MHRGCQRRYYARFHCNRQCCHAAAVAAWRTLRSILRSPLLLMLRLRTSHSRACACVCVRRRRYALQWRFKTLAAALVYFKHRSERSVAVHLRARRHRSPLPISHDTSHRLPADSEPKPSLWLQPVQQTAGDSTATRWTASPARLAGLTYLYNRHSADLPCRVSCGLRDTETLREIERSDAG